MEDSLSLVSSSSHTEAPGPTGDTIHIDISDSDLKKFLYYVSQPSELLYKEYISELSAVGNKVKNSKKKNSSIIPNQKVNEIISILNDFDVEDDDNLVLLDDEEQSEDNDSWFDSAEIFPSEIDFEYFDPSECYYTSSFNRYIISLMTDLSKFSHENNRILEETLQIQDDSTIHPNLAKKLNIRSKYIHKAMNLLKVSNYLQCYKLIHSTALAFCAMMPSPEQLAQLPIIIFEEVMLHLPTVILAKCPATLMTDRRWFYLICKKYVVSSELIKTCLETPYVSVGSYSTNLKDVSSSKIKKVNKNTSGEKTPSTVSQFSNCGQIKKKLPVILAIPEKVRPNQNIITSLTPTSIHENTGFILNSSLLSSPDSCFISPNLNLVNQKSLFMVGKSMGTSHQISTPDPQKQERFQGSPDNCAGVGSFPTRFNTPLNEAIENTKNEGENSPSNKSWLMDHNIGERYIGIVHNSEADVMSTIQEFQEKSLQCGDLKVSYFGSSNKKLNIDSNYIVDKSESATSLTSEKVENDNFYQYRRHRDDVDLCFWKNLYFQFELQSTISSLNEKKDITFISSYNNEVFKQLKENRSIRNSYYQFLDLSLKLGNQITALMIRNENPETVALVTSHILMSSTAKTLFPYLSALDIGKNKLSCDEIECISNALRSNTTLKKLYMASNHFNLRGITALTKALLGVTELPITGEFSYDKSKVTSALEVLYLDHNGIGPLGAKVLSHYLHYNSTLKKLSLGYNQCKGTGVIDICKAIETNKYSKLTILDISHNYGGSDTANAIAKLLENQQSKTKIRTIRCWDPYMTIVDGKLLLNALEKSLSVYELGCGSTCFTSQDRQLFISYLARNKEIAEGNAKKLVEFIRTNNINLDNLLASDKELDNKFGNIKDKLNDPKFVIDDKSDIKKQNNDKEEDKVIDKYAKRRKEEMDLLYGSDTVFSTEWFIISELWLRKWRTFIATNSTSPPPPPIDNWYLIDKITMKPKTNLKKTEDYRGIAPTVWYLFKKIYGGGPAIIRKTIDIYSQPIKQRDENGNMSL